MRPLILAILACLPLAAAAQSPIGITGAEFRLGVVHQDTGAAQASLGAVRSPGDALDPMLGFAAVNVAITRFHGFQGDAVLEGGPNGAIGRLGGHLFMTPQPAHKYGLFGMLADIDGESLTYGHFGVEGMVALSPATSIDIRGGAGAATAKGLDYIFAGARITHEVLGGTVILRAGYDLAEFDEADLSVLGHELTLGADIRLSSAFGGFVEATQSRLTGSDAAPDEVTMRAGVTLSLGRIGGASPLTRAFHTADPVAQLIRRGYF